MLSWLEMSVSFSCEEDLITQIEEVSEKILSVLNIFYKEVEDVKITVDIRYSLGKEIDFVLADFEKILQLMNYERKKTSKNEFRKFDVLKKRNIISLISIQDSNNILEYNINVSIENIVINASNFKAEFVSSLYFFATEYCKVHYNIINAKDKYYIEKNTKFYDSLAKL